MSDLIPIRLALGGDHAGFQLKQAVADRFAPLVSGLIDCGTDSEASCDYPDFAIAVAKQIVDGQADRGLIVCGSGVGVSVAANKIRGIRAAICHDTYSAHQGVEHDDMNVLCIGGRIIGSELAFEIVEAFLRATMRPRSPRQTTRQSAADREKRFEGLTAFQVAAGRTPANASGNCKSTRPTASGNQDKRYFNGFYDGYLMVNMYSRLDGFVADLVAKPTNHTHKHASQRRPTKHIVDWVLLVYVEENASSYAATRTN